MVLQYKRREANTSVSPGLGFPPSLRLRLIRVPRPGTTPELTLASLCSGVTIKTRKRNIAVALDPGSFADAVVTIFEDSSESDSLEQNLQAAVKVLETTALDFSRYGDTLFEVLFAGGRMASGGTLAPEGRKLETNVRPSSRLSSVLTSLRGMMSSTVWDAAS